MPYGNFPKPQQFVIVFSISLKDQGLLHHKIIKSYSQYIYLLSTQYMESPFLKKPASRKTYFGIQHNRLTFYDKFFGCIQQKASHSSTLV